MEKISNKRTEQGKKSTWKNKITGKNETTRETLKTNTNRLGLEKNCVGVRWMGGGEGVRRSRTDHCGRTNGRRATEGIGGSG